jgi:hypothetical protein
MVIGSANLASTSTIIILVQLYVETWQYLLRMLCEK